MYLPYFANNLHGLKKAPNGAKTTAEIINV